MNGVHVRKRGREFWGDGDTLADYKEDLSNGNDGETVDSPAAKRCSVSKVDFWKDDVVSDEELESKFENFRLHSYSNESEVIPESSMLKRYSSPKNRLPTTDKFSTYRSSIIPSRCDKSISPPPPPPYESSTIYDEESFKPSRPNRVLLKDERNTQGVSGLRRDFVSQKSSFRNSIQCAPRKTILGQGHLNRPNLALKVGNWKFIEQFDKHKKIHHTSFLVLFLTSLIPLLNYVVRSHSQPENSHKPFLDDLLANQWKNDIFIRLIDSFKHSIDTVSVLKVRSIIGYMLVFSLSILIPMIIIARFMRLVILALVAYLFSNMALAIHIIDPDLVLSIPLLTAFFAVCYSKWNTFMYVGILIQESCLRLLNCIHLLLFAFSVQVLVLFGSSKLVIFASISDKMNLTILCLFYACWIVSSSLVFIELVVSGAVLRWYVPLRKETLSGFMFMLEFAWKILIYRSGSIVLVGLMQFFGGIFRICAGVVRWFFENSFFCRAIISCLGTWLIPDMTFLEKLNGFTPTYIALSNDSFADSTLRAYHFLQFSQVPVFGSSALASGVWVVLTGLLNLMSWMLIQMFLPFLREKGISDHDLLIWCALVNSQISSILMSITRTILIIHFERKSFFRQFGVPRSRYSAHSTDQLITLVDSALSTYRQ